MIMVFIHFSVVFGNGIAFSENGIFLLGIFNLIFYLAFPFPLVGTRENALKEGV